MAANHESTGEDRRRARRRLWLALVALALLGAGVGIGLLSSSGDDGEEVKPPAPPTTVSRPSSTTTATQAPVTCTLPGGGTAARAEPATAPRTLMEAVGIRAAGVATQGRPSGVPDCAENVVFSFTGIGTDAPGTVPGAQVEYRDAVSLSGPSGEPVSVAGNVFLVVRFEPAQNHTDDGAGPLAPVQVTGAGTVLVREIRQIEDFEGIVVYAIGLDRQVPFSVGRGTGSSIWISIGS
jgi:hypothetical protein